MADKQAFRELRYREMQRDIRFRAWGKNGGDDVARMYEWDYVSDILDLWLEDERMIVMQFTGVKDKTGREIWQDDLIQDSSGRICMVKWHKCLAGWDAWDDVEAKFIGQKGNFKPHNWPDAVVVIGNIHEGICEK